MKNVKVFIASSAELDEDKLQMDLYFSQKNKGYRKRAICFEQRTWRDFPSYLSEEHLQNRYDDYIRQCDIVIFLFHTRLGQYTLRELQVAFEQVKRVVVNVQKFTFMLNATSMARHYWRN